MGLITGAGYRYPLIAAAAANHLGLERVLLDSGADVEEVNASVT